MIPNLGYMESGPQPSFLQQPSPPPGGEARTSPIPGLAPSFTPNELGSQGAQASSSTSSQRFTNQRVELRYDGKFWYII